jgi:hypothetical protein
LYSRLWILSAVAGTLLGLIEHSDGRAGIPPDAWTAIAALLMFLATVALAYIAYNQYTTNQAQTRAYVGIEGGYMRYVDLVEGGRGFAIHIDIRNYGRTPGYHLTSWVKPPAVLPSDAVLFGEPVPVADRLGSSIIGQTPGEGGLGVRSGAFSSRQSRTHLPECGFSAQAQAPHIYKAVKTIRRKNVISFMALTSQTRCVRHGLSYPCCARLRVR